MTKDLALRKDFYEHLRLCPLRRIIVSDTALNQCFYSIQKLISRGVGPFALTQSWCRCLLLFHHYLEVIMISAISFSSVSQTRRGEL